MTSALTPGLLDTGVMLAWANGLPPATLFILAMNRLGAPELSQLSAMELLAGCRDDRERANVLRFFNAARVHAVTEAIALRAFNLLAALALPTSLTPSDALIASTAIEHSLPMYTLDPVRYSIVPGLAAVQPY